MIVKEITAEQPAREHEGFGRYLSCGPCTLPCCIQERDLSPRRPWKVSQLLLRAERAGTQIGVLCHHIDQHQGQLGVRRIQGVLSLAKKYGLAATEDAGAAALEMGVREYRFVRRYLERTPQLSLRQVDPFIRELVHYRDLIQQKTQEPIS